MPEPVTFVTPSFRGDLQRFVFQRESMGRCGIDIPHVVIVDDEDVAAFEAIPYREGLRVVSSRDVLPRSVEAGRRRGRREVPDRRFRPRGILGWSVQQMLKIGAASVVDTNYICIDSDNFWLRPVTAGDFYAPSGKLLLGEYWFLTHEIMQWTVDSLKFLSVANHQPIQPVSYVNEIIPFHRGLVLDLHEEIQRQHGEHWAEAMARHRVIEYTTYGVYARYLRDLDLVQPSAYLHYRGCWNRAEYASLADVLSKASGEGLAAGNVHSRMGIEPDDYRQIVEQFWSRSSDPQG